MPRSRVILWLLPALATCVSGCAGSLVLRNAATGEADRKTASDRVEGPATVESEAARASIASPARQSAGSNGSPAAADLLASPTVQLLGRANPDGYATVRQLASEVDPQLPQEMRQQIIDQAAAALLRRRIPPPAVAPAAPAEPTVPAVAPVVRSDSSVTRNGPPVEMAGNGEPRAALSAVVPASATLPAPVVLPVSPAAELSRESPPPGIASGPVAAGPPAADPPAADLPGDWKKRLEATQEALEEQLARPDLDEGEAARLQTYLRLLYVIADQREQAVTPIDGLGADQREFWKHQLHGLLISLDAEGVHAESRQAALALRDLRAAEEYLANISTLEVRGLAFCSSVESFGRYTEFKSREFRPGEELLLYVEIDHFAAEQKGERYETELQGAYEILDARGARVANVVLERDKQLCNNRRRDYFIAYRLYLPTDIPPGSYQLRLTVEDVKGKKSNQSSIDFRIR